MTAPRVRIVMVEEILVADTELEIGPGGYGRRCLEVEIDGQITRVAAPARGEPVATIEISRVQEGPEFEDLWRRFTEGDAGA